MGLYDTVRIEFNVSEWMPNCPISDEELKAIEYQTKDVHCIMDHYLIDIAGRFWNTGSEFLKKESKVSSTFANYKLYEGSILALPYSGVLNMYSSNEKYSWIEFVIVINSGTMKSCHLLRLEER